MPHKTILASLLAVLSFSAAAEFFVVVPARGKQALLDGISVTLNGSSLPQGLVGQPYSGFDLNQALQVGGDPGFSSNQVDWRVVAGALPSGLTMANGVISGTPAAAGEQTFAVRATYKTKSGEQTYKIVTLSIVVNLAAAMLPAASAGEPYSYDFKSLLSVTGDSAYNLADVSWEISSGSLVPGLSMGSAGLLSGTPSAGGESSFKVKATYRARQAERTYSLTIAPAGYSVEYLVIGGGGGGASNNINGASSGGGGAGGYRSSVAGEASGGGAAAEPVLRVVKSAQYPVVVGAGGAPGYPAAQQAGSPGGSSSFGSIVALGGGGGGAPYTAANISVGSGGGAGAGLVSGANGTAGQGYGGGAGDNSYNYRSGGGGGAGAPGQSGWAGSNGGAGLASRITGTAVYRAGGGAGGRWNGGTGLGGIGGGAADGVDAVANTGGGGGGARLAGYAGRGGSGIVIIRYAGPQRGTGGTVTSVGGYTIHTFTSSGTYTP